MLQPLIHQMHTKWAVFHELKSGFKDTKANSFACTYHADEKRSTTEPILPIPSTSCFIHAFTWDFCIVLPTFSFFPKTLTPMGPSPSTTSSAIVNRPINVYSMWLRPKSSPPTSTELRNRNLMLKMLSVAIKQGHKGATRM